MVLWLKGLALGFAAGAVTMGIAAFVPGLSASEERAPEQQSAMVPAAAAATSAHAAQPGALPTARVQAAVTDARPPTPAPAPAFLDSPPSREALPTQPAHSKRARELAALSAVRAALIAKHPEAALAQLDRYELMYPEASFGLHAQLLRIEALALSGHPQPAKDLAAAFAAAHPESPHAARLHAFAFD